MFSPADFGGDGRSDILARTSTGLLYLYPGKRIGWILLPPRLIARGWNVFSTIISSWDFNGDGKCGVLARAADGTLWMYPGNGTGGLAPRKAVAEGGTPSPPSCAEEPMRSDEP